MKLVHAADLHIDSPLRGLERYEGAPVERIREATRRALENLVDLCVDEEASLLLLAGDLFDGDWRCYSTGLFFTAQMARLRDAGVRVVSLRGNHDAASHMTRHLRLPDNVMELPTDRPGTWHDEALGVAVHGQGFPTAAVADDLAAGYPAAVPGAFNVGLLHTSLDGRPGHDRYAATRLETLRSKGYDYWALGHVHQREVVCDEPWVIFPGNLQGRHARETGPKGATMLSVADGRVVAAPEHRALDVVRWSRVEVDASECAGGPDVVDRVKDALDCAVADADGRLVAARVYVGGTSAAHAALHADSERWDAEVRAAAIEVGGDDLWVEKVRFETRAEVDWAELAARDDPVGQLLRSLDDLSGSDDLTELAVELEELQRWLPREARDGPDALALDTPTEIRAALDDVRQMLLPRLLAEEGAG